MPTAPPAFVSGAKKTIARPGVAVRLFELLSVKKRIRVSVGFPPLQGETHANWNVPPIVGVVDAMFMAEYVAVLT